MSIFKIFSSAGAPKPGCSARELEGVITFFGAHHALKGERMIASAGCRVLLIPGPREISPNCGTALRFDYNEKENVGALLEENNILYEEIHYYPVREV